jgi:ribosomal protein S18 acetylase RimI-like enzyme
VPGDRMVLADLLRATSLIHRHLDWRPPLDWLQFEPFLVYDVSGMIQACLACPVHPEPVAWLRLFMAYNPNILETAWQALWSETLMNLHARQATKVAALPVDRWLRGILEKEGFVHTNNVVSLMWKNQKRSVGMDVDGCRVRPAKIDDLEMITAVDMAAFDVLWQQPLADLELAYEQAAVATVLEIGNVVVGYQISTGSTMGGHLARLAVHPEYQQRGFGRMLLVDLLKRFERRDARWLTVNTQVDNRASLALYDWAGFSRTGEIFPVYELKLRDGDG